MPKLYVALPAMRLLAGARPIAERGGSTLRNNLNLHHVLAIFTSIILRNHKIRIVSDIDEDYEKFISN